MLIQRAQLFVDGARRRGDLRVAGGRVAQIATRLSPGAGEATLDARGGALLPGLHDHHIHLMALAAQLRSVACGPPRVRTADALEGALRQAGSATARGVWIRGTGYHESVAGTLDRARLDAWLPDHPARIQHRSGAAWILNTRALRCLEIPLGAHPEADGGRAQVERDPQGRATGRLFRMDDVLRERLGGVPPALAEVGRRLARFGVTGVSDATASNDASAFAHFAAARRSAELPQRLCLMGTLALAQCASADAAIRIGNHKIVLDEAALPEPDALRERIAAAHASERGVAIHCVTRGELAFALRCLEDAGARPGDRIEHAAVAPPELAEWMLALGVRVVTQPNFVFERGDAYLREVDPLDQPWLYRANGLLRAGIPLAGGSDAPFGDPDPWAAMRAAVDRKTEAGSELGAAEALSPETAVGLFCGARPDAPAVGEPTLVVGEPADLCLLSMPWETARDRLEAADVRLTLCDGRTVWDREAGGDAAALAAQPNEPST